MTNVILDNLCRKLETFSFDFFPNLLLNTDYIPKAKGPRGPSQKIQKKKIPEEQILSFRS